MKHRTSLGLAFVMIALSLASAPARADPPKPDKAQLEEAQRRYQRGRELYEESDFQGALAEMRRAYDLAPSFKLLYDIGQVCFQMQDYPCALKTFTRYLNDGKGDIPAARREEVQADVERLKGRIAYLRVTVNKPDAEIFVDDVSVGKAPLSEPVMVSAGKRKVEARLTGAVPVARTIEVAGQDTVDVPLEIAGTSPSKIPAGGESAAPPPPQKGGVPWVPWVITGGLAVGAGVVGALALSSSSDLETKLDTFGSTRGDIDAARSKTTTLALTTDILLGLTGAMAVTSLVLTLTSSGGQSGADAKEKAAKLPVRLGVGPGSASISGSF
jgi:hypothetical protein